jgi:hypothetical protein
MLGISSYRNTGGKPLIFKSRHETQEWRPGEGTSYLVLTEKSWSLYFSNVPSNADLTRNIYIVASPGTKSNPAYTVKFLTIRLDGDKVIVSLELGEPLTGRFYPHIVVYPVEIAEVAKSQLPTEKMLSYVFVDHKGIPLAKL